MIGRGLRRLSLEGFLMFWRSGKGVWHGMSVHRSADLTGRCALQGKFLLYYTV